MFKLKIEYIAISALRPYPRNARTHSRKQTKQIAKSIREFGFVVPVSIDNDNMILAGHGRVDAARLDVHMAGREDRRVDIGVVAVAADVAFKKVLYVDPKAILSTEPKKFPPEKKAPMALIFIALSICAGVYFALRRW